ncbi:FadR family transcriptional regulator [Arthrobacter gandavensis]|uniref:FadR/GntR family transcriptional regulator n=1 Tax=Arthrobacter gandavensis TaxID=169960 RepID=UPI00188E524D|nr:FCD domain-containing protein [Arthrobacter gandavensis]MBF4992600.1 FadR family transcriptional regulator [Arthrobacter gandavensis]
MAVTDEAITKIKAMLTSGELKAGDRIPPEKELSERLGLSRSSLREAVKALELARVLDVRRGDGTYVTSLEPAILMETLSFVVDLHQEGAAAELLEVRRILEPGSASLAARRITPGTAAELRTCLAAVGDGSSVEDLIAHDLAFHALVAKASGNAYLHGLLEGLAAGTLRGRIWNGLVQDKAVSATLAEHGAIAAAITAGDPDLARALMTVHVSGVESRIRAVA